MDFAGPASILTVRVRIALVVVLLACGPCLAQTPNAILSKAKDLFAHQQWQQLADLAESSKPRSAEMEYLYGTALARLGRWDDARVAFHRGLALAPEDARFPVELAGENTNARSSKAGSVFGGGSGMTLTICGLPTRFQYFNAPSRFLCRK